LLAYVILFCQELFLCRVHQHRKLCQVSNINILKKMCESGSGRPLPTILLAIDFLKRGKPLPLHQSMHPASFISFLQVVLQLIKNS
jgi:hypothetical protein